MSEHSNLVLARDAWNAVSASDVDALRALFSEKIVWHATARATPWSGDHVGPDAVVDFLARIGEAVDLFDARLDDILVSDTRVNYILHVRVRLAERELEVDYQLLARIEGGQVEEVWTVPFDSAALEAFWS